MTRWVCIFDDTIEMLEVRQSKRALHLAYLLENARSILIAGGLSSEPGAAPTGGLWVMEAPDMAAAAAIVEADPYFDARYRRYTLHHWAKALKHVAVTL